MAERTTTGYREAIAVGFETVRQLAGQKRARKAAGSTEDLLQALRLLWELLRVRIHEGLALEKTAEAEAEIRELVKRVISEVLPIVEAKLREVGTGGDDIAAVRLRELYDNYYTTTTIRWRRLGR